MNTEPYQQLQMVWPTRRLNDPPVAQLAPGYALRTYQPGDEPQFYALMEAVGWPGWDDDKLRPWLARVIPEGWFVVVECTKQKVVASAMALHNHTDQHPFGGELGWVACHPAHTGRGLGLAVSAAVTSRLIAAGYRNIHLYTEDWRLAALKTYLKLGYVPFIYAPPMEARWRAVCEQLRWPFTPDQWQR